MAIYFQPTQVAKKWIGLSLLAALAAKSGVYAIIDPLPFIPPEDFVSCLNKKSLSFVLPETCSYDLFKRAAEAKMSTHRSCRRNDVEMEIMAVLNVGSIHDAKAKFDEMCQEAIWDRMKRVPEFEFDKVTNMDRNFNKAFFDGGSSWIDGGMPIRKAKALLQNPQHDLGASDNFHGNSKRIKNIYENVAKKRPISWPDNLENFDGCAANSAMCCWVDHETTQDVGYKSNTDLCYVDYTRAPSSSFVKTGLGLFGESEEVFCHGFAWEEGSIDDAFKGNLLFLSEVHENMHNRGHSKNVVGAPMCGCIEQMPVVTRADCSKLEWSGKFVFKHTYQPLITNIIRISGPVTVSSVECDGLNGQSNDLGMYYEKLYLEGKVNATQKALLGRTLVGHGNCSLAVHEIMSNFSHWASALSTTNFSSSHGSEFPIPKPTTISSNYSMPSVSHPTFPPTPKPTPKPTASSMALPNYAPHPPFEVPSSSNITSSSVTKNTTHEITLEPPPINHFSSQPSITPITSPTQKTFISLQPSALSRPHSAAEFDFVGYGTCLSSLNHTYDQYAIDGGGLSPEICSGMCLKHEGFVGFNIQTKRWCICYYEGGFCPNYRCNRSNQGGRGNITYSTGSTNPDNQCYAYQRGPLGMPSMKPVMKTQPSLQPSVKLQP